jgi:hypothetical protein
MGDVRIERGALELSAGDGWERVAVLPMHCVFGGQEETDMPRSVRSRAPSPCPHVLMRI